MFRIHVATAIIIAMFAFVDSANATNSRAQGKAGQRAICHDKIRSQALVWRSSQSRVEEVHGGCSSYQ